MPAPVRVAICEDSRMFAIALRRFLEREGKLRVVGVYRSAEELLTALPDLSVELVTMDLELPGMDGVDATAEIMRTAPHPVVVVSGEARRGTQRAADALAAGALDVVSKTRIRLDEPDGPLADALRRRLSRLARATPPPRRSLPARPPAKVIVIAASTGGPAALATALGPLPAEYRVPVLVVQHMSVGFTAGLAGWLDDQMPLPVGLAEAGAPLARGVWLAPDGAHLELEPSLRLALNRHSSAKPHRPAADILMRTAAAAAGSGAVGVVLTGMGRDGADGIAAIREAGGLTIAQDEQTSVIYGMPRAAAERGAELILPLDEIGGALASLATGKRSR